EPGSKSEIFCARLLVAAATVAAFRGVWALFEPREAKPSLLFALAAAALAQFVMEQTLRTIMRRGRSLTKRGALAWLTVASSGMLMSVGYHGVNGRGEFGISGALLFGIPLAAAWYAFERLDSATLAYRQTIESLAMAPELGGLVPDGHAERV